MRPGTGSRAIPRYPGFDLDGIVETKGENFEIAQSAGPTSTCAISVKCWRASMTPRLRSAKVQSRRMGRHSSCEEVSRSHACLPAAHLVELRPSALVPLAVRSGELRRSAIVLFFRLCAQVSSGPEHLLLIGFPILRKQFHLSPEPALIFFEYIGARLGIGHMLGHFKRSLHTLATTDKPSVRKFLEAWLLAPTLAFGSLALTSVAWLLVSVSLWVLRREVRVAR